MSFYTFSSKSRPVIFISTLLILLAVLAVIVWSTQYYFLKTGDLVSEEDAVNIQHSSGDLCLYDSLAANNHMAYKLALYDKFKPKVVVIGSSRVLQFGAPMFGAGFINMGRTMNYLLEGPATFARLLEHGKPELILLGIDFWWFNPNYRIRWGQAKQLIRVQHDNPAMLKSLIKNSITHPQFLGHASALFQKASCHLGVAAKTYLNGFGPDGFRYHGAKMTLRSRPDKDRGFANTLKRIKKGKARFEHADAPDQKKMDRFMALVETIRKAGIQLVIFMPPVAPTIANAMEASGKYAFILKIIAGLRRHGLMVHDFHMPDQLNLTDCNFLDGFHAGDVAAARILAHMAKTRPGLHKILNHEELSRLSQFSNRAEVYYSEAFGKPETDFLGLGCVKS